MVSPQGDLGLGMSPAKKGFQKKKGFQAGVSPWEFGVSQRVRWDFGMGFLTEMGFWDGIHKELWVIHP